VSSIRYVLATEARCAFSDARKKRRALALSDLPPKLCHLPPELCHLPPKVNDLPPELCHLPPKLSDLPPDLEELVLSKLSLHDLARVSPTCRSFHTVFRRQLAQQQKACYDLAVARFGNELIDCIADLMDSWLEGKVDSCIKDRCLRVCQTYGEGLQQVKGCSYLPCSVRVAVSSTGMEPCRAMHSNMSITVPARNNSCVCMDFFWHPKNVVIHVIVSGELEGLVLVQALFSRALASTVCEAWRRTRMTIVGGSPCMPYMACGWRQIMASHQAQFAPLLALLSPYPNWCWAS
jgi:hypothetical protein